MQGLEDIGAVVGEWKKPFQDQDLVASISEGSLGCLWMNYRKKITYVSKKLCYIGS